MVTIDVGQVVLGRPWLFDKDVNIAVDYKYVNSSMMVRHLSYFLLNPKLKNLLRHLLH